MSRNDPLGDLLINVRASADQFTADMKKVQSSATNTTDAIIAGWGKSGAAADKAISNIERRSSNKAVLKNFQSVTDGIVNNWGKVERKVDDTGNKAGSAGNKIADAGKTIEESFKNAGATLSSIEQMLGVNLPSAATKFITTSRTIGPILAGAFSGVAVLGLIDLLGQLPALFDKIGGAITGWDETAKKAYDNVLDYNRKAIESLQNDAIKTAGILAATGQQSLAEIQETLELRRSSLQELLDEQKAKEAEMADVERRAREGGVAIFNKATKERLAFLETETARLALEIIDLERQEKRERLKINKDFFDELGKKQKEAAEEAKRYAKELTDYWRKAYQELVNRTFAGGEDVQAGLDAAAATAKKIIEADKEHAKFMHEAGDELIRRQQYWDKALQDFRNQVPAAVAEGERHADDLAKKIIDLSEKARNQAEREAEQLFNSVKSTATRAFLDIFDSGESIFTNLANVIKGIFRTLAAELLSTMTASFLTPLVGKITGVMGLQAGGKLAGGLTGAAGLSAAISALFAGPAVPSAIAALPGTLVPGTFAATIAPPALAPGAGMAGLIGGLATNPITWAVAGGLLAGTVWMKSQAHHEASTFVKTLQDPFGAELDRIMASSREAADKLEEIEDVWAEFSEAAVAFAQGGEDEALVVKQAFETLNPLMESLRRDLTTQAEGIRDVTPTASGPVTVNLQMDGRTFARLVIPNLYALTRNEGMILVGAK